MYKHILNINFVNKVISLIIACILFIIIDNIYLLGLYLFVTIIVSCFCQKRIIRCLSIIELLLFFFLDILIVNVLFRVLLIISVVLLFGCYLKDYEKRYLFNKFAYCGKKCEKMIFKHIYYNKLLNKNKTIDYLDDNEKILMTKKNMNELYLLYKIRFYKYYHNRTNFLDISFYKEDVIYLFLLICLFVLSILL